MERDRYAYCIGKESLARHGHLAGRIADGGPSIWPSVCQNHKCTFIGPPSSRLSVVSSFIATQHTNTVKAPNFSNRSHKSKKVVFEWSCEPDAIEHNKLVLWYRFAAKGERERAFAMILLISLQGVFLISHKSDRQNRDSYHSQSWYPKQK